MATTIYLSGRSQPFTVAEHFDEVRRQLQREEMPEFGLPGPDNRRIAIKSANVLAILPPDQPQMPS